MGETVIWFISDEHLGHGNIIDFCRRPFGSVGEMNAAIVRALRVDVGEGDVVWHLGDFGRDPSLSVADLPGTHLLVRGNHDRGVESMRQMGFAEVVVEAVGRLDGKSILLRHRPLYDPLPEGMAGVFHGHVHNARPCELARAGEGTHIPAWNVNLCVEATGYRPQSYRVALRRLSVQRRTSGE